VTSRVSPYLRRPFCVMYALCTHRIPILASRPARMCATATRVSLPIRRRSLGSALTSWAPRRYQSSGNAAVFRYSAATFTPAASAKVRTASRARESSVSLSDERYHAAKNISMSITRGGAFCAEGVFRLGSVREKMREGSCAPRSSSASQRARDGGRV
jgi:hypothetical protein